MGRVKEAMIDEVMYEEMLKLKSYIEISSYRKKVVIAIGERIIIPTEIAKISGIRTNHISKVLKELKDCDVAVCINEEVRKGRLYKLTPKGLEIYYEIVRDINGLQRM